LDPELVPILEATKGQIPPLSAETLPAIRLAVQQLVETGYGLGAPDLTAGGKVRVEELQVPGPEGAPEVTLVVLRPAEGNGPWPLLYNAHGGGMMCGVARLELPNYVQFVAEGLAVVAAVEYRLAPEHPDPAPIEDCYAGIVWAAHNPGELSIDPEQIIVIGESAGGGLAAGLALLARDRGFPAVTHQVLICPMLDDRAVTPSSQMLGVGDGTWNRDDNFFGWTALLGDRRGGPDVSIYAAPARAEDLTGLPRTYIDVGGSETFRDEAIIYAQRLSQAGVSVDFHLWAGGYHGYELSAPHAAISRATRQVRDAFIRRALTS